MPAVDADSGAITNPLIRTFAEVRKGFTAFRDNDVILAKITPCMENGKAAVARGLSNGLGFGSTEFQVARGAAQPTVTLSDLKEFTIPLPPLAEQQEIVRREGELFALADRIEARLDDARQMADQLTQAVLAKAFRGELLPNEAELARREKREYEPASKLLERVRGERVSAPPPRVARRRRD